MTTLTRRDPLAGREAQPVALASEGKQTTKIDHAHIRVDGGTQMRAELNQATIEEYADAIETGALLPPLTVYYDGADYWLGDGFHRLEAMRLVCKRMKVFLGDVVVDVRPGTRRDAILHAAAANADHGLRRTNADKRRAVEVLLTDEEWRVWSDREIARRCKVSNNFVSGLRTILSSDDSIKTERTFTHPKTGQPTTMRTDRISAANSERAAQPRTLTADETRAVILRVVCKAEPRPAQRCDWLAKHAMLSHYTHALTGAVVIDNKDFQAAYNAAMLELSEAYASATLAAMATGEVPPDVAAALVEPADELPGAAGAWVRKFGPAVPAGTLADDEAPPVLPVDLVMLGCRLAVEDGFYHVRYGSHRSEYASLEAAVAWCRRITGTDVATQAGPQGTRQDRIASLLALYQQVMGSLSDYGALTGDFTGALPLRRALEPMVAKLEANLAKGAAS